jgi:hypothetical protein
MNVEKIMIIGNSIIMYHKYLMILILVSIIVSFIKN